MKILVVDDEGIVLDSCERVLNAEGYEVQVVTSAEEALATAEEFAPSLLIIDVKMPVHDGIYIMRELKRKNRRIPVIVMSGLSTEETIEESYNMGANIFLPKPFTPDELLAAVRQVLAKEAPDGNQESPCD